MRDICAKYEKLNYYKSKTQPRFLPQPHSIFTSKPTQNPSNANWPPAAVSPPRQLRPPPTVIITITHRIPRRAPLYHRRNKNEATATPRLQLGRRRRHLHVPPLSTLAVATICGTFWIHPCLLSIDSSDGFGFTVLVSVHFSVSFRF